MTVSPVCFLVIGTEDGSANILGINAQASDTVDRLVEMIPGCDQQGVHFVSGFGQDRGRSRSGGNPVRRRIKPRFSAKTYSRECWSRFCYAGSGAM